MMAKGRCIRTSRCSDIYSRRSYFLEAQVQARMEGPGPGVTPLRKQSAARRITPNSSSLSPSFNCFGWSNGARSLTFRVNAP